MTARTSTALTFAGLQDSFLLAVELRAQSNLLQALLGTDQAPDELSTLRNDQAFSLGVNPPVVPGN